MTAYLTANLDGTRPPIVLCQTWADQEPEFFERLAPLLGPDQPVIAILRPDALTTRLDDLDDWVAFELEQLATAPVASPYRLVGWSFGGIVALEVARTLIDGGRGDEVASTELIDSWIPERQYRGRLGQMTEAVRRLLQHLENMERMEVRERPAYAFAYLRRVAGRRTGAVTARFNGETRAKEAPTVLGPELRSIWVPWLKYEPQPFPHRVALYVCERSIRHQQGDASLGFGPWFTRGFTVHEIPGRHESMLEHPNVEVLAAALTDPFNPG